MEKEIKIPKYGCKMKVKKGKSQQKKKK